ncbi:MAG: translocation/assembly module TamB domain-containing protein [Verrucomicrobia bacterium]|nr:translocation/assembly module TamB domain-containing protein [Verrucomicrobiota bacterium]
MLALKIEKVQQALGVQLSDYLTEKTGRPVAVGKVGMLLPLHFSIDQVETDQIKAQKISFSLRVLPLLAKKIELQRLKIQTVTLEGSEEKFSVRGTLRLDKDFSAVLRVNSFIIRVKRDGETAQIYLKGKTASSIGPLDTLNFYLCGIPSSWQGNFTASIGGKPLQGVISKQPGQLFILGDTPWSEMRFSLIDHLLEFQAPSLHLDLQGEFKSGVLTARAPTLRVGAYGLKELSFSLQREAFALQADRFSVSTSDFDALSLSTQLQGIKRAFFINWETQGKNSHEGHASGWWGLEKGGFTAELTTFAGVLFHEAVRLEQPWHLSTGKQIHFSPLKLQAGAGTLFVSETSFLAHHFPLTIVELLYPRLKLEGFLNGSASLEGTQGKIDLNWRNVHLKDPMIVDIKRINGSLQGTFADERLNLDVNLNQAKGHLSLPLRLFPFAIPPEGKIEGTADFIGQLAPFLQFLLPDTVEVQATLSAHVQLSGTAGHPQVRGNLSLAQGRIDDVYSGAHLENLEAYLVAEGNELRLERLFAEDGKEGRISAQGVIAIKPSENYPLALDFHLDNTQIVNLEVAQGRLSGNLGLHGTLLTLQLTGELSSPALQIHLDQDLPPRVPLLNVRYINVPSTHQEEMLPSRPFDVQLALSLKIPRHASIEGKGIKSQWRGEMEILGTANAPFLQGALNLREGNFELAGREFKLTQGILSFDGPPETSTWLDLTGTLEVADVQINANIAGVIPDVKLNFYSSPPLTEREILSYVLFGGPTSEITAAQAIQLAQVSLQMAGGNFGPDLFTQFHQGIGIDTLTISSPSPGSDEYGILIGKRFGKNVEVHVYRSINQEFDRMRIELELFRQIYLAAETSKEEEEGGRYSIFWKRDL